MLRAAVDRVPQAPIKFINNDKIIIISKWTKRNENSYMSAMSTISTDGEEDKKKKNKERKKEQKNEPKRTRHIYIPQIIQLANH